MGLQIEVDDKGDDTVTLRLEGTFDGKTAELLRRSIQSLNEPGKDVVLDFSRVRSFVDLAVAVLTRDLPRLDRLKLLGLAGHQERVFQYFGFPKMPPTRAYYQAEDVRLS